MYVGPGPRVGEFQQSKKKSQAKPGKNGGQVFPLPNMSSVFFNQLATITAFAILYAHNGWHLRNRCPFSKNPGPLRAQYSNNEFVILWKLKVHSDLARLGL